MPQTKATHCKTRRQGNQRRKQKTVSLSLPPIYRSTDDYYNNNNNYSTGSSSSSSCTSDYNYYYHHKSYTDNQQSTTTSTVSQYNNPLTIEHNHISLLALINTVYPPLQCIQCNTVSPTHQEEQNHFRIHPPRFNCLHPHCELSFRTKSALRFHISRLHLVKQKPINMITPSYSSVRTTAIPFNNKNIKNNNAITIVTSIDSVPTSPTVTSPPTPPIPIKQVATSITTATTAGTEPTIVESDSSTPSPVHVAALSPSPSPPPATIKKQTSVSPSISPSISPCLSPLSSTSASHNQQHDHQEQFNHQQQQASSPSSSTSSSSYQPAKKRSPTQEKQKQKQKQKNNTISSPTSTSVPSWRVSSFGRSSAASRAPRGSKKIILSTETEALLNSIYNPLQCPSCHQRFKRKTNVIKHLTDQHYGEEPYRCIFTDCVHPKLYATREGLVYHILRVHDQPSTPPPTSLSSSSAPSSPPPQHQLSDNDSNVDHTIIKKNNIRPANNNKIQNSTKRRRVDR